MTQPLDRHTAKVIILKLLIAQAQKWTFGEGVDDQIPAAHRATLREVRDEYVAQLQKERDAMAKNVNERMQSTEGSEKLKNEIVELCKASGLTILEWLSAAECVADGIREIIKDRGGDVIVLTESGWLLERRLTPSGQEYLTIEDGGFEWTTDNQKALRLARRADADLLSEIVDDCERVAEHQWN